jgi:hypothetical protein
MKILIAEAGGSLGLDQLVQASLVVPAMPQSQNGQILKIVRSVGKMCELEKAG